jgi:wyosine [tRNA(Phe)-imidazoG37] synthetase (radical SAM superfamily)
MTIAFGPVPSRRLGSSLGINNIPPKSCSYSCVYCQVGPTAAPEIAPRRFYDPARIRGEVEQRLAAARRSGHPVDFLTFVPDGEPTLDARLDESIELLRPLGVPIAVISNGSLMWRPEVRHAVARADWVSLKLDAVDERTWRRINRPHESLRLDEVLEGMRRFAAEFAGQLATETMLVAGVNVRRDSLEAVARFAAGLQPHTAYIAVPIRPPAEPDVSPPDDHALAQAYAILAEAVPRVEYLVGDEEGAFVCSGDLAEDLLAIAAVHPMREAAVEAFVRDANGDWRTVEELVAAGKLLRRSYRGVVFYLRARE